MSDPGDVWSNVEGVAPLSAEHQGEMAEILRDFRACYAKIEEKRLLTEQESRHRDRVTARMLAMMAEVPGCRPQ